LFLPEDLEALKREVSKIKKKSEELGEETRTAITQSSETWHDNFGFEENQREQIKLSAQAGDYLKIISRAHIVSWPGLIEKVAIGHIVSVKNLDTGKISHYQVGSYITPGANETVIPYCSPLGKSLIGKKKGDEISFETPSGKKRYKIESLEI